MALRVFGQAAEEELAVGVRATQPPPVQQPQYRGPPLRVTNPERFNAFLRESAAYAERKMEEEDAEERARAAREGDRYRTRAERAAAKAAAEERARSAPDGADKRHDDAQGGGGSAHSDLRVDPEIDLYAVLGVTREASRKEIRRAFRRCALRYHPDKQAPEADDAAKAEAEALFQAASQAAEVLLDPARRAAYDAARARLKGVHVPLAASKARPAAEQRRQRAQTEAVHVRLSLPLRAYIIGGCFPVSLPGGGTGQVHVQKGARPGDTSTVQVGGGQPTAVVTLSLSQEPSFALAGRKDVLLIAPPPAPPQPGDLHWAQRVCGPCSDGNASGFACVSLLLPWLAGDTSTRVAVPGLGLPDAAAPFFEPPGDLLIDLPLADSARTGSRSLRLDPQFARLGALVLAGSDAPAQAIAAAMASLQQTQAERRSCVCLLLGGDAASPDVFHVRSLAAAACPHAPCSVITAPLCLASRTLALLEDDWAQLGAASVVVIAVADPVVDFSQSVPAGAVTLPVLPAWPLLASAPAALPSAVEFAVVHTSSVAIRAHPTTDAECIGRRGPAARVVADARFKDWVRLAQDGNDVAGMATSPSGEAWMLTCHPLHGQLLMPVEFQLATASQLRRVLPAGGAPTNMRVYHTGSVAVRVVPRADGQIVASRRPGDTVTVLGVHDGWARVTVPLPPRGVPPFGWMMVAHPTLGQLLTPAMAITDDDSSSDDAESQTGSHALRCPSTSSAFSSAGDLQSVGCCSGDDAEQATADDVASAAADCGLLTALHALRCAGTHLVFSGGPALHLCGVPPAGAPAHVAFMPQCIVRQSDGPHLWHSLLDATAACHAQVTGVGLERTGVVALPTASDAALWKGYGPQCDRQSLRDAAAAAAASAAAAVTRRKVLDALRWAAEEVGEQDGAAEDTAVDVYGYRRGRCAPSGCAAYRRPRLPNAGPNAGLLLTCAACGDKAIDHERL